MRQAATEMRHWLVFLPNFYRFNIELEKQSLAFENCAPEAAWTTAMTCRGLSLASRHPKALHRLGAAWQPSRSQTIHARANASLTGS